MNRRASDGGANLHKFCRAVAEKCQTGSVEGLASVSRSGMTNMLYSPFMVAVLVVVMKHIFL